jgi:hypothetical protein
MVGEFRVGHWVVRGFLEIWREVLEFLLRIDADPVAQHLERDAAVWRAKRHHLVDMVVCASPGLRIAALNRLADDQSAH